MTPEGLIKRQVNTLLAKYSGVYRFMPVPGGFGISTLDYLVCFRGQFVAIETKAPGKKPTPRQLKVAGDIRAAGGRVFFIDGPAGLAELDTHLRGRNSEHWEAIDHEPADPD